VLRAADWKFSKFSPTFVLTQKTVVPLERRCCQRFHQCKRPRVASQAHCQILWPGEWCLRVCALCMPSIICGPSCPCGVCHGGHGLADQARVIMSTAAGLPCLGPGAGANKLATMLFKSQYCAEIKAALQCSGSLVLGRAAHQGMCDGRMVQRYPVWCCGVWPGPA